MPQALLKATEQSANNLCSLIAECIWERDKESPVKTAVIPGWLCTCPWLPP